MPRIGGTKKERIVILLPRNLLNKVDAAVKTRGYVNRTQFITEAIVEKLAREETSIINYIRGEEDGG